MVEAVDLFGAHFVRGCDGEEPLGINGLLPCSPFVAHASDAVFFGNFEVLLERLRNGGVRPAAMEA